MISLLIDKILRRTGLRKGPRRRPGVTRGRLFFDDDPEDVPGNHIQVTRERTARVTGIRVFRADGTIEVIRKPPGD